ncbi:hypothetical protein EYF80_024241 [Liparis tanakae]|uniref:Uncharacterized protein n=1 Tax=Liparis tanakae TaxID=230148 RepID=A0A4Z2HKQ9_9TELE|nr:hypothetical protein EYF80_024241 [Liparis tanakae]
MNFWRVHTPLVSRRLPRDHDQSCASLTGDLTEGNRKGPKNKQEVRMLTVEESVDVCASRRLSVCGSVRLIVASQKVSLRLTGGSLSLLVRRVSGGALGSASASPFNSRGSRGRRFSGGGPAWWARGVWRWPARCEDPLRTPSSAAPRGRRSATSLREEEEERTGNVNTISMSSAQY